MSVLKDIIQILLRIHSAKRLLFFYSSEHNLSKMPTSTAAVGVMDISESATAEPLHIFKSCLDNNVSTGIAAIQGLMQVSTNNTYIRKK